MNAAPMRGRAWPLLWPAFAGAAQALSIAWPGSGQALGWLQVLSLVLLAAGLAQMARQSAAGPFAGPSPVKRAAWLGGVFAAAWLAGSFWWLYVSMHHVGGLPAPLAVLAVLALAGALALYYAAASAVWVGLARGWVAQRPGLASGLFAALWTLAELMRGRWFTGFPWGAGGYAHVDGVLVVWAPWLGVYGVGALAAWLAMRLALAGWRLRALKPWLGILLASWGLQAWGPTFTTSALQQHFAQPGRPMALVGAPLGSLSEGYANSVVAIRPEGLAPYRYDKSHLVPFGEFMPPGFVWFIRMMNIPLGEFKSGGWRQPSLAWQGQRLAPNVCYEDLFGEELAMRFTDPATAPTALVNVSNIAWFGDTLAVDQHLSISRLRAIELGRPMLRATNTGATAIIDHTGKVTEQLPRFTRGSLTGTFEGRNGLTPFAWWAGAWGLAPLWALCLSVVAWAAWKRRKF